MKLSYLIFLFYLVIMVCYLVSFVCANPLDNSPTTSTTTTTEETWNSHWDWHDLKTSVLKMVEWTSKQTWMDTKYRIVSTLVSTVGLPLNVIGINLFTRKVMGPSEEKKRFNRMKAEWAHLREHDPTAPVPPQLIKRYHQAISQVQRDTLLIIVLSTVLFGIGKYLLPDGIKPPESTPHVITTNTSTTFYERYIKNYSYKRGGDAPWGLSINVNFIWLLLGLALTIVTLLVLGLSCRTRRTSINNKKKKAKTNRRSSRHLRTVLHHHNRSTTRP